MSAVRWRIIEGKRVDIPVRGSLPVRGPCEYLGKPLVMKNCNCYANEEHHCKLGLKAIPNGNCQTCQKWESLLD